MSRNTIIKRVGIAIGFIAISVIAFYGFIYFSFVDTLTRGAEKFIESKRRTGPRSIIVYASCEGEATFDLERSINLTADLFRQNGIDLEFAEEENCGYKLVDGDKEKFLYGAMTDYDLLLKAGDFFRIKFVSETD